MRSLGPLLSLTSVILLASACSDPCLRLAEDGRPAYLGAYLGASFDLEVADSLRPIVGGTSYSGICEREVWPQWTATGPAE